MTEEPKNEESRKSEADSLFNEQSGLELNDKRPVSSVTTEGEEVESGHGDISDIIEHSRKKSDIQIIFEYLFPSFPVDWLGKLPISRVFPDVFTYMISMIVKELVGTKNMSVVEAIVYANSALSIGIDGEGRIDAIHIGGKGAEAEENKKNTMGIP